MNKIIVVNKEKGPTSFDVVHKIKKIFNTKKVGHLGTLDPLATGVLVVCINEATKIVQFCEYDSKEYDATITLGIRTDSLDSEGTILERTIPQKVSGTEVDQILKSFLGKSMQVPPLFSAIKKNGKKLYEYARNKEEVEIEPREIEIFSIYRTSEIHYDLDTISFDFHVEVSKGTYIRSLCNDIAERLNTIGIMSGLNRTRSGMFKIEDAATLEQIERGEYKSFDLLDAVKDLPTLTDEDSIYKARHGMKISKKVVNISVSDCKRIIIVDKNTLIAVYDYNKELDCYCAVRVWN